MTTVKRLRAVVIPHQEWHQNGAHRERGAAAGQHEAGVAMLWGADDSGFVYCATDQAIVVTTGWLRR
jgi:hypothetical protein